jgi:DNA mismatch endonuclease (patch repair protein)
MKPAGETAALPLGSSPRRRLSPETRRRVMASIRKTNTRPELALRRALRQGGLAGYRLHTRGLPGTPDVAYTRWKVAIFVDGVFWHGRPDYFQFGTKGEYWDKKIQRNIERDHSVTRQLQGMGWRVLRFWDVDVLHDTSQPVAAIRRALQARGKGHG